MSLSTIDWGKDNMKTTTRKFQTRRFESTNLNTQDISGNRHHHNIKHYRRISQASWL
jgi:hypothetical protein